MFFKNGQKIWSLCYLSKEHVFSKHDTWCFFQRAPECVWICYRSRHRRRWFFFFKIYLEITLHFEETSGAFFLMNEWKWRIVSSTLTRICISGAHHIDLRASTPEDPDWLVEQRATEVELIKGWLNEYYDAKMATSPFTSSAAFSM